MNNFQPTRNHFANGRDAAALARSILAGDEEAATEMTTALMGDPASIPVVLSALSSMIGQALAAPQGTPPALFFEAVRDTLDSFEERDV